MENIIKELENKMNDYSVDFVNDYYNADSMYLCDAISEFADSNTSIYYSEIMDFIAKNPEAVNNAINEFGWNGCGNDIYKAGQMAEYQDIQNDIYADLDNVIKLIAYKKAYHNYDIINPTEQQYKDIDDIDCEGIDTDSRIEDIEDYVKSFIVGDDE